MTEDRVYYRIIQQILEDGYKWPRITITEIKEFLEAKRTADVIFGGDNPREFLKMRRA